MNKTSGRPWSGWQAPNAPPTRVPHPGDRIQSCLEGGAINGVVIQCIEIFENRPVVLAELAIGTRGSTVLRRLIESLDEQPSPGTWIYRNEKPKQMEVLDAHQAETEPEAQAAAASRPGHAATSAG